MSDLALSFGKPFNYQLAALRLRFGDLHPTAKWDDIWQDAHNRAFMVAGAIKADLVADFALAIDKAVSQGTGLQSFAKDFRAIVEKHGWHGWTGEGTKKGEAWRIRTIYGTNMRVSYAAGRFAQLKDSGFKYWVYRHGNALEPRLQHLAWDGLILEVDHPFWNTHFPPNGWGCTCRVFGAHSIAGAVRKGGKAELKLPENWNALDPRTGAPPGVGKGWAYAPGASVAETVSALRQKLELLPERPSIDLIQSWLATDAFASWLAAPSGSWPLARVSPEAAALIGSERRVAVLSAESAIKQVRNHPDLRASDYAQAQKVVDNATRQVQQDARRLIFIQEVPGENGYVMVVKAVAERDELFIVSFRKLSKDEAKRDRDIRGLLSKGV